MEVPLIMLLGASLGHLWLQWRIYRAWGRLTTSIPDRERPLSIVVAAHNELPNLQKNLASWLNQRHQHFEVLLVLDRCSDGSELLARQQAAKVSHLRILEIAETPPGWSPKKWALQKGIEAAQYEWLLFTDADCQAPADWAATMAGKMAGSTEVVLGLSPLDQRQTGWPGKLASFETLMTAFLYAGRAALGKPYMGVGRNLAYRKSWFDGQGGFSAIADHLSGDDDLLVNQKAEGDKTAVCWEKSGQTVSVPPATLPAWIIQKLRHASTGKHYSSRDLFWLTCYQGLQIIWYWALVAVFISKIQLLIPLAVFTLKQSISYTLITRATRKAGLTVKWYTFGLFDFCYFTLNLFIIPLGSILKPQWRKREPQKYRKTPSRTESW